MLYSQSFDSSSKSNNEPTPIPKTQQSPSKFWYTNFIFFSVIHIIGFLTLIKWRNPKETDWRNILWVIADPVYVAIHQGT
jgi:hypothetical protein